MSQVQAMSHYGYEIVQTLIVDIEPDQRVKGAMNEINAGKYHCCWLNRNLNFLEIELFFM